MKLRPEPGLTFDDVLLIPKRSGIRSRSDVSTRSCLVAGIELAIPIISANMDTVTESQMAIAMAQNGEIGIIHRFMSIEQQVEEVRRVKRSESLIVENPVTIDENATIEEGRAKMDKAGVGGLVVVDGGGRLVGMLTKRDVLFAPNPVESIHKSDNTAGSVGNNVFYRRKH